MNISLFERFRKITSVALITAMVFSFVSPAFAAVSPTFNTTTVSNLPVGADAQTFELANLVANVPEVKASRTLTVSARPGNNETITIGQCVITFQAVADSTADELNCNDNAALIDRNTGTGNNDRNASTTAGRLRALTNVNTANHGILVVTGSGTTATFTTGITTETTTSGINFVDNTEGNIVSTSSTQSVIPDTKISTLTVNGSVDIGDVFTVTSGPFGTVSFVATTTSPTDVATGLNTAIHGHATYPTRNYTTSVEENTITLEAKNPGMNFTNLIPTTTNFPGVAQVVTFTPAIVVQGLRYTVTINDSDYTYTSLSGATIATVTNGVTSAIANPAVVCVNNTTNITCTANVAGTAFTYSASVVDVEAPVITLSPGSVNLFVGDPAYVDEIGFTAADNVDGDVTSSVAVTNTINQSVPGWYVIDYNVSDFFGNATILGTYTRAVTVSDNTGPDIMGTPASFSVETIGDTSQVVEYGLPTATDDVDAEVTVTCSPASGSIFPHGLTPVTCEASDVAENETNTTFNIIVEDTVNPTSSNISIISNNANSSRAKAGDTITVSFTTSEPVTLPTATIAGKTATVVNTGGNTYTATYILTDTETQLLASFAIDFADLAPTPNTGIQVTSVTDSSSVTIDTATPVISNINSSITFPPGAYISWTTNEASTTFVEYGLTDSYGSSTTLDSTLITSHTANITGLAQTTSYHFRVISVDAAGNISTSGDNVFTTSGATGGSVQSDAGVGSPATPTSNPTTPTPAPTPIPAPTPTPESTPTPTPAPQPSPEPTPATPEVVPEAPTPTPESTPTQTPAPQTPSNSGGTGGTTGGGTGTGGGTTTGGTGTGGTTGGGTATFDPADATLDIGGGTAIEGETLEEGFNPADATLDVGGGAATEEQSYTLLWILLGLLALLSTWWFFVAKNRKTNR